MNKPTAHTNPGTAMLTVLFVRLRFSHQAWRARDGFFMTRREIFTESL